MTVRAPALAAAALLALAATGCNRPAALAFEPKTPLSIDEDHAVPVPRVVALDKDGKPLKKTPRFTLSVDPPGALTLDNGKILPAKNGDAKVVATAEGLPKAELPVHVSVVDDVHVICPEPCGLHAGENIALEAVASGLGEKVTETIEWSSSAPETAKVDAQGYVTGVAAGTVAITARCGKKATEVKLEVRPAIDELRLTCPWPPLVVVAKKGATAPASERSCEVLEGDDVRLEGEALSHGVVVPGERIEWRSSDPSVRVVSGIITGDHPGGAMIELHAGALVAELPASVIPSGLRGIGTAHCGGGEASLNNRFEVPLSIKTASGEAQEEKRVFRCESTVAKRCLDEAAGQIARAVAKITFDIKAAMSFAESSLDERARRCCCRH